MTTRFASALVLGGVLLAAPAARAEGFGSPLTVAISGERLFGVVSSSTTQTVDGQPGESTSYATSVSLVSNPIGGVMSNYSFARVGVDVFAIQGLSLGAALGYVTVSTSSKIEANGMSVEQDGPTLNGFLFASRVGYAFMFIPIVGIWPRAGITYVSVGTDYDSMGTSAESSASLLAFTLEVPLVISPSPNAAITVGPTLDLGLSGGTESKRTTAGVTTSSKTNQKGTDIGLQAGLAVAF